MTQQQETGIFKLEAVVSYMTRDSTRIYSGQKKVSLKVEIKPK